MLLELADECKQNIWEFLDVQELCRLARVARNVEQGVCMGPLWQRHARALLTKGQEAVQSDTGVLSCSLQRRNASRNLLATVKKQQMLHQEEEILEIHATIDWKLWCRDTHVFLVRFNSNNSRFARALSTLQELKSERSQLKEAMQKAKASSHADKRTRRIQMNCVKWMNRTHRRQTAASNSIQAQTAALTKSQLVEKLQRVENEIQTTAKDQFGLRKRAMNCLTKLNNQLASGTK
ncbi:hypothetical protein PHMEG_00012388, partial [Phytophthora megakarya]